MPDMDDSASVLFTSYEDGRPTTALFLGSEKATPEPIEVELTPQEATILSSLIMGMILARGI